MKVLHVTFNMGIGGTEQVIRQLVTGMQKKDVNSEILCIDGKIGPIGEALQKLGIPVHAVSRHQGFDTSLITAIRKHLREGRFDIVHCHQYTPWVYGWLGATGTKARVVFTEHGRFHPDRHRYKAMLINPLVALLTPAIVAISEATKRALVTYEFIPKRKINVIYNGIAPISKNETEALNVREQLGIPPEAFVVGTVSRLDPVKNQQMMLEAFQIFSNKHPEAYLLMVGDGPDKAMLMALAEQLDIQARIIFTGFINKPEHHLSAMDVFLLSSHTEGTSMTLLEAMSLGIPAVATRVGGNPEIVDDGITGILTDPGASVPFATAIETLFNSERRSSMGVAAKTQFNQRFSASGFIDAYYSIYGPS